ncbi:MAG: fused MFS/spermidine synthase [Deltaproteobacteria bacterium]|nr:fused MFS/spermidine synthase [Deltaproteobacteria bacterium]MBW2390129.1 fused MFS/spermidine synthase [Deltaproteobacteria bacterium]
MWFHQAGIALGNSLWASSLVLAGFMGGLALGNAIAARWGEELPSPIRMYAWLETVIAVAGVSLVLVLPALGGLLAVALSPLEGHVWLLNACRLSIAFLLLLIPSTAMGCTLPLLTRALTATGAQFGRALGGLYGWNTLGAVFGALAAESHLIGAFGITGTALLAGAANLGAAFIAGYLALRHESPAPSVPLPSKRVDVLPVQPEGRPWLVVAFASGFVMLALEVVWFRFLSLYVVNRSASFAVMLAIVLGGIAAGGFVGSRWLGWRDDAHRHAGSVAFAAGALCVGCYALAPSLLEPFGLELLVGPRAIAQVGVPLMFPVSFLSGVFFTLVGAALRHDAPSDTAAVGALTFANTTGAALGSLCAGFVLLPLLGMEDSLYAASLCYGVIGTWALLRMRESPGAPILAAALTFAVTLALFPFGSLETRHLSNIAKRWIQSPEDRVSLVIESPSQTLMYIEQRILGEVHSHRLVTNALSMAGSHVSARRYSKLYVYLPVAIHPDPKNALVISFGLGSTAKALTDTAAFEHIDVVDISKDILERSSVVYADDENPLHDPRVEVHVEDGRYFLQATDRRFDLITGEPPPPGAAGVVNLYTREYFELVHDRLAEGGIVSYWLPIHAVPEQAARAILRSFCDVFDDCSLWNGIGRDLMLVGTRGAAQRVTEEHFVRQWHDPKVVEELVGLGFERPEQLGALFIGGADYLKALSQDTPPLVDDFPKRIHGPIPDLHQLEPLYLSWTDTNRARDRFLADAFVKSVWPPELREASRPYFDSQRIINTLAYGLRPADRSLAHDTLEILTQTELVAPVMWLLGTNADFQRIAAAAVGKKRENPDLNFHEGAALVARRRFEDALGPLERSEQNPKNFTLATSVRILALCAAGRSGEANDLARERRGRMLTGARMDDFLETMSRFCTDDAAKIAYAREP